MPSHRYLKLLAITLAVVTLSRFIAADSQIPPIQSQAPPVVSATGRRIYEHARGRLLQVRTMLKGQDSQASVGSGFIVSREGHIITNYHVVSQVALEPERYRLIYSTTDRKEGALQLLAFDARHDLALVKPATPDALADREPLVFRPRATPVEQGDRIYSLGNPLDVGFAVMEGTYNGLVERSFYPTIFFAGSLNPGVSGGPTLDHDGRIIGVNVAHSTGGEQVSFLVPAEFAQDLLERGRQAPPITDASYPELTRQLAEHQIALTDRFLAQPWRQAGHANYRIPMPQEQFMRCWGSSSPTDEKGLEFQNSSCQMDTPLFVSGFMTTGSLSVGHEAFDGGKLGVLRFARRYSSNFGSQIMFDTESKDRTALQCHERYVDRDSLPMRAVICVSAYKKLKGLYDLKVLVATVDASTRGVQGQFEASGVTFENGLRLATYYIDGFGPAAGSAAEAK